MPTNFNSSPYVEMIPMVRSEISDVLVDDLTTEDLEYTDEEVATEINYAVMLKITRDIGNTYKVTADNLDPLILSDAEYLYPTVIQAALRLVHRTKMIATSENIDLRKTGTAISTKSLVEGLIKAEEFLKKKYQQETMATSGGIRIDTDVI